MKIVAACFAAAVVGGLTVIAVLVIDDYLRDED